jgi:hypothetical protein
VRKVFICLKSETIVKKNGNGIKVEGDTGQKAASKTLPCVTRTTQKIFFFKCFRSNKMFF